MLTATAPKQSHGRPGSNRTDRTTKTKRISSKVHAHFEHYSRIGKAGIENIGRKFPLLMGHAHQAPP